MAKNNPPRKPLPSETIEAIAFRANMVATTAERDRDKSGKMQRAMPRRHHLRRHQGEQAHRETAKRRAQRRPESGLRQQHLAQRHAAHDGDAKQRRQNPEQRCDRKITPQYVADRTDADAERQHRESMGDKIAG